MLLKFRKRIASLYLYKYMFICFQLFFFYADSMSHCTTLPSSKISFSVCDYDSYIIKYIYDQANYTQPFFTNFVLIIINTKFFYLNKKIYIIIQFGAVVRKLRPYIHFGNSFLFI